MFKPAILVLEDGSIFHGISIGADGEAIGEVVFNTAMTGYQEILTDPSYARQMVALTYPHIGNTGVNSEDEESDNVWAAGLIIRELPPQPSNWRSEKSLSQYLQDNNIVGIAEIDTRRLTRILSNKGARSGCLISGENLDEKEALKKARDFSGLRGMDLAQEVSSLESYPWFEGSWTLGVGFEQKSKDDERFHVVAYDFGVKKTILRMLSDWGCRLTVVPAKTSAQEVLKMRPDGIFLSNGPGDPEPCDYAINAIKTFLATNIPLFGICLGHQLLALACGASTVKMKFGHHGANHPVQDVKNKTVMITSQNHGFAVDEASLPANLRATHRSLFDGSLQGIEHIEKPVFGFQGHPEASPGPHDSAFLFERFFDLMSARKK